MENGYPEGLGPDDPTAGDRAHTDHAAVSFTIKEHGQGEPWVMFEMEPPGLPVLKFGDAFLGLQFKEDVSFEEARNFAREMSKMFNYISYTKFDT